MDRRQLDKLGDMYYQARLDAPVINWDFSIKEKARDVYLRSRNLYWLSHQEEGP